MLSTTSWLAKKKPHSKKTLRFRPRIWESAECSKKPLRFRAGGLLLGLDLRAREARPGKFWGPKRSPERLQKGTGNGARLYAPKAPKPFEFLVFRGKRSRPKGPQNGPQNEPNFGAFWGPLDGRAKRARAKILLKNTGGGSGGKWSNPPPPYLSGPKS